MADVLPVAIAIAASPFPVIPAILLLFTPRARASAAAFLGGWLLGVAAVTTVFVLLADVIELLDEPPAWATWTRIVGGTLLVVWGVRQWLRRHQPAPPPAWMTSITSAGPGQAVRLALLLSAANPKVIALAAAGGLAIGADIEPGAAQITTVALFSLVASISVAVPVVAYLVAGDRVLPPLGRARDWLERNNAAVMAVVFMVLGLALLLKGVTSL